MKQSLQNIIADAIARLEYRIILPKGTQRDEIDAAISVFTSEHKKFLWFSHPYSFNEESKELCLRYNFTPKIFFKPESEKTVNNIFQSDAIKTSSDFDKVLHVYKWIASQIPVYGLSDLIDANLRGLLDYTDISLMYAKSAQYLLELLGIESRIVFGKLRGYKSDNSRHTWTIVEIDNNWYHIDLCLANRYLMQFFCPCEKPVREDGDIIWNYFCKSTEFVLQNRSIEFLEDYPRCVRNLDKISNQIGPRCRPDPHLKNDCFNSMGAPNEAHSKKGVISKPSVASSAIIGIGAPTGIGGAINNLYNKVVSLFRGTHCLNDAQSNDFISSGKNESSLTQDIPPSEEGENICTDIEICAASDICGCSPDEDPCPSSYEKLMENIDPDIIPSELPSVTSCDVNACVYAPAEVRYNKSFIIRVYMYRQPEMENVDNKVKEIEPSAVKKDYKPLDLPVQEGDKLTVQLELSEGCVCKNAQKSIIWRNRFTDCSFMVKLTDPEPESIEGATYLFVNDIPAGEMLFVIDVVESQPRELYSK